MLRIFFLIMILMSVSSCYQRSSDDSDLNTNPITNNPTIVPHQPSFFPGI